MKSLNKKYGDEVANSSQEMFYLLTNPSSNPLKNACSSLSNLNLGKTFKHNDPKKRSSLV